jgi:hypothetical protein
VSCRWHIWLSYYRIKKRTRPFGHWIIYTHSDCWHESYLFKGAWKSNWSPRTWPRTGRQEERKYRWAHIYIPSTSIDHAANLVVPALPRQGQASRTFAFWRLCWNVFWSQARTLDATRLCLHLDMIMPHDWLLSTIKGLFGRFYLQMDSSKNLEDPDGWFSLFSFHL